MIDEDKAHVLAALVAMHALISSGSAKDLDATARVAWAYADAMMGQLTMRRRTSRPPKDDGGNTP